MIGSGVREVAMLHRYRDNTDCHYLKRHEL